jgi:lauroyl/myristoyl acyltransferase
MSRLSVDLDREARCYLGLRAALDGVMPPNMLASVARDCVERMYVNQASWNPDRPLPPIRIDFANGPGGSLDLGTAAVMCTVHVGPYHRIPFAVMEMGVPVTLVLDTPNLAQQQADYDRWRPHYTGSHLDPMRFINAESAASVWQMATALRSGRSLFVYADGHAGFQKGSNAGNVVEISFCGLATRVRKGLAYLSAATGAPIVPVIAAFGSGGRHVLTFDEPMERSVGEPVEEFCHRALQHVYALLEDVVLRDPACWEEWFHFYEWIVPGQRLEPGPSILAASCAEQLDTRLELCADRVEVVVRDSVSLLVNTFGGEALVLSPILKAVAEMLDGTNTIRRVLERLAPTYESDGVLDIVRRLAAGSFVKTAA